MRFSVTQLRIGIFALNLLLTLLICGQTLYGVFNKVEPSIRLNQMPPTSAFHATSEGKQATLDPSAVKAPSEWIVQPPPPPKPLEEKKSEEKPPPPVEPGALPPGPLEGIWELSQVTIPADSPEMAFAVLTKVEAGASPVAGKAGAKAPPRIIRPSGPTPVRTSFQPKSYQKGVPGAPPSDKKILRLWEEWKDDDANLHLWVGEITQDRIVYENAKTWQLHELRRKQSPYRENGSLKTVEEPPDPNNPEASQESKKHFLEKGIDRRQRWDDRKISAAAAAAAATGEKASGPGAIHPAQQPGRPLSQEEQLKQLGETLRQLPKDAQGKINKALEEGLKKRRQ